MFANLHTHTARCHHASGADEEYVKVAIKRGVKILGFSDHTPYFFDAGYRSPAKMDISDMPDYFASILALKEKYKSEIEIKVGFETEYFPKFFDRLIEEYRKYPLDYIILAQHIVGDESTPLSCEIFSPSPDRSRLTRYVDQCIAALDTGRFTYFAHPDAINYVPASREDEEFFAAERERLVRAAIKTETPIEINLCGVRNMRNYPSGSFWQLAGKLGATAVVGCDAHAPLQVADEEELAIAKHIIRDCNLNVIDMPPLKNPIF